MRPRLLPIALSMMAGLAISVAGAWLLSARFWITHTPTGPVAPDPVSDLGARVRSAFDIPETATKEWRRTAPGFLAITVSGERQQHDAEATGFAGPIVLADSVAHMQAGWPCKALSGTFITQSNAIEPRFLAQWDTPRMHLPYRPRLGLVANTVFFGLLAWAPIALLTDAPRRRRRARGRCARCGYPVPSAAICPECGTASGQPSPSTIASAWPT